MLIGKYNLEQFVEYLTRNPDFMSDLLTIMYKGQTTEVESAIKSIQNMDLNTPFTRVPTNKSYLEHKNEILSIINDKNAYSVENLSLITSYQKNENIQESYTQHAEQYDQLMTNPNLFLDRTIAREEAMRWLDLKPNEEILECGIGTGMTLLYYPEHARAMGIDINEAMLKMARKKLEKIRKNVTLLLMNAERMTFEDNRFDKILSYFFLCTTQNPLQCLKEIRRVCKKNGKIVILDIVQSNIDEYRLVQYLVRPIVRALAHVYIPEYPVYSIPFDCCLDTYSLLDMAELKIEKKLPLTPAKDIALIKSTKES